MTDTLNVVGLGPGSSDLITLRGLRTLRESEIIFVPVSGGTNKIAKGILQNLMSTETFSENISIVELRFPMTRNRDYNRKSWDENILTIKEVMDKHERVSYAVLGNPLFFSTFNHIGMELGKSGIKIHYIAGVSAIDACPCEVGMQIGGGDESILITTYEGMKAFKDTTHFDTILILKIPIGSRAIDELGKEYPDFSRKVYVRRCSMEEQFIAERAESSDPGDYFSMLILKR